MTDLRIPAPTNSYCVDCLKSTEHVDLEFDLEKPGTLTCIRCKKKKEPINAS